MYKTLWFTHEAHQDLLRLASQAVDGSETCGQLFGYSYSSVQYAVVTCASGPGVDTVRHPDYCNLGVETQVQGWSRFSKGCIHELGSWHTHPFATAEPSPGDHAAGHCHAEWNRDKRGWDARFEAVIGVPPGGTPQTLRAWLYSSGNVSELEVRVADADWQPPIDEDGNWIEKQGVS